MSDPQTIDFGYKQVPVGEKEKHVAQVFHSVAGKYDLMNDLMSAGIHRLWKRYTVDRSGVRKGMKVLDIAGGTGDLTMQFADRVGDTGEVILSDINASMLEMGRERLLNKGYGQVEYVQANAEKLPFRDNRFDIVSIAFGLRNVTHKDQALREMCRILRPGGRLLVLEFSKPVSPTLARVYDEYSFKILPLMGELVAHDRDSYQYLAESIRMHPDQETLRNMIEEAGFVRCDYTNLTGGIVALHTGVKP